MSRNDAYTIANLLDISYHQNYYKLINRDLSRQTNTSIPQKFNFLGKIEDDVATMFFIAENQDKKVLNSSLD